MSFFMSKTKTVFISAGFALIALSNGHADEVSSESTYDWTGVYVGGYVGGASGADVTSSEPYDNIGPAYWSAYGNNNNNYSTNSSFIGGGTVGYNWQIPTSNLLIGLEGEYGYLGATGGNIDPNSNVIGNGFDPVVLGFGRVKIGNDYGYGFVGGRLGYSIDRVLLYVKGGAVFTSIQSNYSDSLSQPSPISATNKTNNTGYAIGAGFEYALPFEWTQNISVKTEYLYFGIDRNISTTFTDPSGILGSLVNNTSISGIHTAKIGLNYKF